MFLIKSLTKEYSNVLYEFQLFSPQLTVNLMKIRLLVTGFEACLLMACLTPYLSWRIKIMSFIILHLSFLAHSLQTNLKSEPSQSMDTTDFLVDSFDGNLVFNFVLGFALLFFEGYRLLGFSFCVSGIFFLIALRCLKEQKTRSPKPQPYPMPVMRERVQPRTSSVLENTLV